jgi:hypothetical protein
MVMEAIKATKVKIITKDMEKADAIIIEISQEDFQLGHEATLAIQNKKPVLCLSVYEDFSQKITNAYFFGAKYNEYTVGEIVADFISKTQKRHYSERFNLFLSPAQEMYLERAGKVYGLNKSEYVRMLIDKDRG